MGWRARERQFGVWLSDEAAWAFGQDGFGAAEERTAAVVDFKLTSGEPGENHRMQLAGYAMLVERRTGAAGAGGVSVPDTG